MEKNVEKTLTNVEKTLAAENTKKNVEKTLAAENTAENAEAVIDKVTARTDTLTKIKKGMEKYGVNGLPYLIGSPTTLKYTWSYVTKDDDGETVIRYRTSWLSLDELHDSGILSASEIRSINEALMPFIKEDISNTKGVKILNEFISTMDEGQLLNVFDFSDEVRSKLEHGSGLLGKHVRWLKAYIMRAGFKGSTATLKAKKKACAFALIFISYVGLVGRIDDSDIEKFENVK